LVSVGVVALDGTAIAADASPAATRTHEAIRHEVERMLGEAAAVDAAEDERYGDARGDELPAELVDRRSRLERLRRCREELETEQAKSEAAYQENLRWRAEWEAEHGRKLGGRKPFPPDPESLGKRTINTTDPDSRVITRTGRAPVQGYNAQIVTNTRQIIIAADVTQQSNDSGQLEPMIRKAVATLEDAGVETPIGTVLADGGYWNSPQMRALGQVGIATIIPTRAARRTKARKLSPKQGPEAERINAFLATSEGAALLSAPTTDDRAGVRQHQVHPRHHPVSPSRVTGVPRRVAVDRGDPQSAEALPSRDRRADRLSGRPAASTARAPAHRVIVNTRPIRRRNDKAHRRRALRNSLNHGAFARGCKHECKHAVPDLGPGVYCRQSPNPDLIGHPGGSALHPLLLLRCVATRAQPRCRVSKPRRFRVGVPSPETRRRCRSPVASLRPSTRELLTFPQSQVARC
jgi:hypothetical protein